ncbi:MAG: hypothetical protein PVI26_12400 [Chitinispirillia bacterium]|jgi:hypothetical protein
MVYKTFSCNELETLTGKYTDVINKELNGSVLLFVKFGARLLGMFPDGEGDNVLWVNQELEKMLQISQAMIGGERLWISPEKSFFYENPRDFEGHRIPSEIDPGDYSCIRNDEEIIYENVFSLLEYDKNELFDNSIEKRQFKIISDPYNTGLPFVGVKITDTIIINDLNIEMSAWSHTQVYTCGPENPGTVLFPVRQNSAFINYFNTIPENKGSIYYEYAVCKIDAQKFYKIAISPDDTVENNPCKIVYLSQTESNKSIWKCVIKRSLDLPKNQNECLDISKHNPKGLKGAIQILNPGYSLSYELMHPYGELEFHFPRGIPVGDQTISKADHELLSYLGSKKDILELARTALKINYLPVIY